MSRAWFLNLGPSTTTDREASSDIKAMLNTKPALVLGCEAIGKGALPHAPPGYVKIRDTSIEGRANIFAYVQTFSNPLDWKWTDCNKEFPRNNGPGQHWPRSILQFPFGKAQIVVAHKPPLWKGAGPARWEHDQKLAKIMEPNDNPKRTRLLFWDSNGMDGAEKLADKIGGRVIGSKIDNCIVRKVDNQAHDYKNSADGHVFHTDHPWGALWVRWNA